MVVIIGRKIGCKEKSKFYASAYVGKSSNIPVYWLAFTATVQPLGFSTYVISSGKLADMHLQPVKQISYPFDGSQRSDVQVVRSGNLKLVYSGNDGKLMQYINSRSSITRVYEEKEHVEIEFMVGPIPFEDGIGKQIVTQTKSTVGNNKTFYTDSNGRDFLERIGDYRADWDLQVNQPIAGNYYPINLGIYIKYKSTEFSILVDRSIGGSSIVDGQLDQYQQRISCSHYWLD